MSLLAAAVRETSACVHSRIESQPSEEGHGDLALKPFCTLKFMYQFPFKLLFIVTPQNTEINRTPNVFILYENFVFEFLGDPNALFRT